MPYLTRPDGAKISWEAHGPPGAPPLLLCTMATAAMSVWTPLVEALSPDWRVLLHDRRGEGDSDAGAPATHTFETMRDGALAVMDAAGAASAAVAGMAFGARVALRIALDAPDRVTALILFDATGGPPAPPAERTAGREGAKGPRAAAGLGGPAGERGRVRRRDPEGEKVNGRALAGQPAWMPGLERISAPTLVACGEQDPNLPGSRRLATESPGARLEVMPTAGHGSILDRPDHVAACARAFLEGLPA